MSPRSNLRVAEGDQLKRNHEDDEEPSEETGIWDTAATRQWMKPIRSHHFRTDDFIAMGLPSGAQHESKDSNWPLNTAAFVETPSGVNQWTRPVGFLNAVKWFWPQGTIAKVVDDRGITHSLTWRKLLGVGGMGGVLFVEDEDEPLTSPLKRFAGKIIYQQSEPSYELSQAKKYLYQIRDEEIGVASLFEQAALSLHDCPPTTAGRMRFLFKKGFVLPQTMFRLEGTTQAPRLGDIVEASPEIVGSPDGLLMRLDPHVIAYPILGPDLENLEVPEWNLSTITYTIYKLTHLMATMQEMNLVHTDVKAENFLAGDDGELFVADLAMAVKAGPATLTPCFQGTVSYLDPKVAACAGRYGSQSPTAKRDAYALGVTFYKLLCRRKPFQLEQLEHEATEQDQKRQPSYSGALHLLSGISKLRRKDWVERECPIADESLLTITKLLLDPQEGTRWTPLDLVKKVPFFKPVPGI
ncbi:unnamed protein product [Neospora caninum Liverpool]|nr:uncharacterized protein NCLIV_028130 [Neospora caninum Liverpool]CBZ53024.1 unnamed protein product [Neospora caninum Liverpool]|eukprot:XP_003883056.1 uncharacterized protein NCLIV_028130 [Neospora caninum Liverpool]